MTAKEIFAKIKDAFNAPIVAAAPTVPPAPTVKPYKLQDGTEISITQASETPAAGDMVSINGLAAAEGLYTLEDGSTITVDGTGMIVAYTPAVTLAAPPTPAPAVPVPPPAPAQPVTLSAEEVKAMYEKFATGSTEERMSNLETMVKALMECSFGYEIRKGIEQEAVQAYKDSVALQVSSLMASSEKVEAQEKIIAKHEETIKGLFELVEKLVELPTADPVTLTGNKKALFEKMNAKEERMTRIADALKKNKALA